MYRHSSWAPSVRSFSSALLFSTVLSVMELSIAHAQQKPSESQKAPTLSESSRRSTAKTQRRRAVKQETAEGIPSRRIAGATRDAGGLDYCAAESFVEPQNTLLALTPPETVNLTHYDNSTLYFYVPKVAQASQFELVLRDAQDRLIVAKTIEADQSCGIVGVTIPQAAVGQSYVSNQLYHWYFSMIVDPVDRAHDLVVEGQLQWLPATSDLQKSLVQASSLERVRLYQQANRLTDAFATLVPLKLEHPEDPVIATTWQSLLQAMDFETLAQTAPSLQQ